MVASGERVERGGSACLRASLASGHTQARLGARAGSEQTSMSPRTGSDVPRYLLIYFRAVMQEILRIAITTTTIIITAAIIYGALRYYARCFP